MKVYIETLGCPKNFNDTEVAKGCLCEERDFTLADSPEEADIIMVNTCGFIDSAKQESIDEILELATLKKEGRIKKIVVTGCLAERYREEIHKELPEVDGVMGTGSYTEIVPALEELMAGGTPHRFGDIDHTEEDGARIPSPPPTPPT